jgi:hypothetical protein
MSTADAPIAPQGTPDLAKLIDEAGSLNHFDVERELHALQATAAAEENVGLASAVRCEANVYSIFRDENTLMRHGENITAYLYPTDIPYLRERAAATPNLPARARYLHAIVSLTKRQDDGRAAVDAMIDALREARSIIDLALTAEPFHALVDLYPLAFALGRRFRYTDPILDEAIAFLDDPDSPYLYAKTRVFVLIVRKVRFSDAHAQRLRPASLHLPAEAYGDSRGEVMTVAAAARSLADRLGEPQAAWLEAEAAGLEAKIRYNQHPMLVQMVAQRLLRIYQLLGDEARALSAIERGRTASAAMEYSTITVELDGAEESERIYRGHAKKIYAKLGPLGSLAWLATNDVFPKVDAVRATMADMEAKGIGSFRKIATTYVSADERVLAEDPPNYAFDEQYDIAWTLAVKANALFLDEFFGAGLSLADVNELLCGSWFAFASESDPLVDDLVALLIPPLRLLFAVLNGDDELRIPALDSLVMRVETMLRKLAQIARVPHVRATDRDNRPLLEYADLKLLEHTRMQAVAGKDLVAFAQHTLLRAPEGLRARIGHGLLKRADYRMVDLYAMLLLYLRFAVVRIPDDDSASSSPK